MRKIKNYLYNVIVHKENLKGKLLLMLFLNLLSNLYIFFIKIRISLYKKQFLKSVKLNIPVISIGNITTGGSGKTPFAIFLAKKLVVEFKKHPSILLRGYGARVKSSDFNKKSKQLIDEEAVFKENIPEIKVLIGKNRIDNIKRAINKFKTDCIILDDGYQYLKLKKDMDIVLIKAITIYREKKLLPAGLLREPYSNLNRADVIIITDIDRLNRKKVDYVKNFIYKNNKNSLILAGEYKPLCFLNFHEKGYNIESLSFLKDTSCLAVSGIGDPDSFSFSLKKSGLKTIKHIKYPDHYNYRKIDIQNIIKTAKENNISEIITTQKDIYKILFFKDLFYKKGINKILVLKISLELTSNERLKFNERLSNLFNSKSV